jgi:hypothetical protein
MNTGIHKNTHLLHGTKVHAKTNWELKMHALETHTECPQCFILYAKELIAHACLCVYIYNI